MEKPKRKTLTKAQLFERRKMLSDLMAYPRANIRSAHTQIIKTFPETTYQTLETEWSRRTSWRSSVIGAGDRDDMVARLKEAEFRFFMIYSNLISDKDSQGRPKLPDLKEAQRALRNYVDTCALEAKITLEAPTENIITQNIDNRVQTVILDGKELSPADVYAEYSQSIRDAVNLDVDAESCKQQVDTAQPSAPGPTDRKGLNSPTS